MPHSSATAAGVNKELNLNTIYYYTIYQVILLPFQPFFWYFDIPVTCRSLFLKKWKYTTEKQTYFYFMYRLNFLYHIADIVDYNIFLDLAMKNRKESPCTTNNTL